MDPVLALRAILQLPLVAAGRHPALREAFARDVRRQLQPRLDLPLPAEVSFPDLVRALAHKPLRSILYARLGNLGRPGILVASLLSALWRGEPAFEINCGDIGPGLMAMHGFATIVVAERIGTDCQVAQQVTVGYSDAGGPPVLGDRVRIGAGAIVIGPITVGDDAVIGAGAVVVKDVEPGTVVGGVPARVLEGAADRFRAPR